MKNDKDLFIEIVKAIEAGVNKHLGNSMLYSPFKVFFNLFKRANPNLMNNIRGRVRNDIYNRLTHISGFNTEVFLIDNNLTDKGHNLLKICYNLGIHFLKKELTVVSAFKVVTNHHFRSHMYNHILDLVSRSASRVLHK
jgi:hypothetical protein